MIVTTFVKRIAPVALSLVALAPLLPAQPHEPAIPPSPDRVAVSAGPFAMGADRGGEDDEHPRHTLTLPAFRVDRTEVTNALYARCVAARGCTSPRALPLRFRAPDAPVVGVSWPQARAYCAWARGRLPTEREWEKAARGTDGRRFPWGDELPTNAHAVFGRSREGSPEAVGTRPRGASPYGALDMAGNVWEWTESPYDPYAYHHTEISPTCENAVASLTTLRRLGVRGFTGSNPLPRTCERVLRGGAWNYPAVGLRTTNRVHHPPGFQIVVAGFRCVDDAQ